MTDLTAPLTEQDLSRRDPIRTGYRDDSDHRKIVDFYLPDGKAFSVRRDERRDDWFRLSVQSSLKGAPRRRRFEEVKAVCPRPDDLARHAEQGDLDGRVTGDSAVHVKPRRTPPTRFQSVKRSKDRDPGGTIFGLDDRYLFDDTSFPWRTTGQIRVAGGRCSGTTIGPRLVLTASHCINWTGDGGAGWVTFTPGYFDGSGPWGEFSATHVVFWNQAPTLLTDQETAFDYVVLVMEERVGDIVGYPGYRTYNSSWNDGQFWQYIGYPGELAGGERPAFQGSGVISSAQGESLNGQNGLVLGHFNEFTPGQSGGAAWGWWADEPWPRVVGVGSTIGSTAVQAPTGSTVGDNEYGGGPALSALISWARSNFP